MTIASDSNTAATSNSKKGVSISFTPLRDLADHGNWSFKAKTVLINRSLWSDGDPKASPKTLPGPIDDTEQESLILLFEWVHKDLLDIILDEGHQSASAIWTRLTELVKLTPLTAQANSLQQLSTFEYPRATMLENKGELLRIQKELKAAFGGDQISILNLVTLFAIIRLQPAYHMVRTGLEVKHSDSTNSLTLDILFKSLYLEEGNHGSSSNLSQAETKLSETETKLAESQAQLAHFKRELAKKKRAPFNNPSTSKSTLLCKLCKNAGYPQHEHHEGSRACLTQQVEMLRKSSKFSSTTNLATSTVEANLDSGSSDHVFHNKEGSVSIYSSIHHPITCANNSVMIATQLGRLHSGTLPIDQILVAEGASQNLLSVSKLNDAGLDVLFSASSSKAYVGRNFTPKDVVITGRRKGNAFYVDIPVAPTPPASANSAVYFVDQPTQAATAFLGSTDIRTWHLKYNHLNQNDLHKLARQEMVTGMKLDPKAFLDFCNSCLIGKLKKGTSPKSSDFRAKSIGEMVWMDIIGYINPVSERGFRYLLVFLDDHSRYLTVFPLKTKDEAFHYFEKYDNQVYNRLGRHTVYLRSDNVMKTNRFTAFCHRSGTIQQFTVPHNSQQNREERWNLTIMDGVRASIAESKLPKTHWDLAAECVAYTRNYSPTSALPENIVPAQLWWQMDRPPSVQHLQIFGSPAIMRIPTSKRKGKVADRGMPCTFVGYDPNRKGYRLLLEDGRVQSAVYQDVVFVSSTSPSVETVEVPVKESERKQTSVDDLSDGSENPDESFNTADDGSDDEEGNQPTDPALIGSLPQQTAGNAQPPASNATPAPSLDQLTPELQQRYPLLETTESPKIFKHPTLGRVEVEPATNPASRDITGAPARPKRQSKPPSRFGFSTTTVPLPGLERLANFDDSNGQWRISQCYSSTPSSSLRVKKSDGEPQKFADIINHPEEARWRSATDAEIAQMAEFGTWELVPLPAGRSAIKSKWVFKIKRRADGEIEKYKARLTACGYSQRKGIDYQEVYAPVFRLESFRLFLAITAQRNMTYKQMDVKGAFLHGEMDTETFMRQPEGYEDKDHPEWVCHLKRTIYGLKQSGHRWHKVIDPFLRSLGFKPLRADPCIYRKWQDGRLQLVSLYVDNLGISCDSEDDALFVRQKLMERFEMTDEPTTSTLNIQIRRDENGFYLSQPAVISALLEATNMTDCLPASTPAEAVTVSSADCPTVGSDEWHQMKKVPYRETIGSLTQLMRTCRPEIAFPLSVASRYLHNPGQAHWNFVKRILRYLKGSINDEFAINPTNSSFTASNQKSPISVQGHTTLRALCDADWGGDRDSAKSTSGFSCFFGGALISWASKVQTVTATSSTYAEYISAYHTLAEILWSRSFLSDLGLLDLSKPTDLYTDNEPAINIAKFDMVTNRSKHFDTKYHFFRDSVADKTIAPHHIAGKDNCADIFTKALLKGRFLKFKEQLGVKPSPVHHVLWSSLLP